MILLSGCFPSKTAIFAANNSTTMSRKQQQDRPGVNIRVEPYLAQYARLKFETNPKTGGIMVPSGLDLYHCIWNNMQLRPIRRTIYGGVYREDPPEGNLLIHLPNRRGGQNDVCKDPRSWNYISLKSSRIINRELKRLFDWEFHHYMDFGLQQNPQVTKKKLVQSFVKKYQLGIDTEDSLLKNYQRYEQTTRILLGLKKRKTTQKSVESVPTCLLSLSSRSCGKSLLARLISEGLYGLDNSELEK